MLEEHIEPSMTLQTEFDEWIENGCEKAAEIICNSDTEEN